MSEQQGRLKALLAKLAGGATLSADESEAVFSILMSGNATPAQIGGLLMALRVRARALHVRAPEGAVDIVGTGGDGAGTFNISTGAALVVAACGVPVAKHGNRALSSKCGAADVLAALGVNVEADLALVERAMREVGIGFLLAPRHHVVMRHVAQPRVELGVRTIFNLLGPLSNPANVTRQFVGAFARHWIEPMAHVLRNLGSERAWVVHGWDGLDELTNTGPSYVAELDKGLIRTFEVLPSDAGLPLARPEDLKGGDIETNAVAMRAMLEGERGSFRDAVIYNAAAALLVAGRAADLRRGAAWAAEAIDAGRAEATLRRLVELTNLPVRSSVARS